MRATASAGTVPVQLKGIVHATSMLANLFKENNWLGRFSRVGDWNDSLTITKDLLEFLVMSCELSDLSVLSFGKTDLETLQMPFPWALFF